MDYDDLLVNWLRLLTESPEARREVTSRFSHILVDEYQDTNLLQAEIVRLLAHRARQRHGGGRRCPVHLQLPGRGFL